MRKVSTVHENTPVAAASLSRADFRPFVQTDLAKGPSQHRRGGRLLWRAPLRRNAGAAFGCACAVRSGVLETSAAVPYLNVLALRGARCRRA
jgi:hypothetical protein